MSFLSGLFGGSDKQETEVMPWAPATPALNDALNMTRRANETPWEMYGGEQVAGFHPIQMRAMEDQRHYAFNDGKSGINQMANAAGGNLGAFGQAQGAYLDQLGRGPAVNQGPDLGMARSMSENPYMDEMVGAAVRDVGRNLYEQQMPGIAAYSSDTGNLGSSRRGMLEGMAQRAAGDRVADISAQMRGNAYNQGLGIASNVSSQNAQLDQANQGMNLGAAQGLQGLGNAGMQGLINAQNLQTLNNQNVMGVGNMLQQQQQNINNQAQQNHYMGQQMPYQQAQAGAAIASPIASGFPVQTSSGFAQSGSPFGQIAGLGMQGLGMFGLGQGWFG